jgi:hypothetical protein
MPRFHSRSDITAQNAQRRASELASLLPLWPHELADETVAGLQKRLAILRRALRAERCRGLAGHWTYDLARHSALLRCYRREVAALAVLSATVKATQISLPARENRSAKG